MGERSSHRGREGWSCGRYFPRVLSWQLSQGIPFPAFVTGVVRWELNGGIQLMFNFCRCCGCAPSRALHLVQGLSLWALGILLCLSRFLQAVWRKEPVCLLLLYFDGFFPSPWRCPGTALAQSGMGRGCGEEVLAAVWVLQEQVMLSGTREKHRLSLNSETPWDLCWVTLELRRRCPNWRAKTQLLFVPTSPCLITLQHHPCPQATCALCLLFKVSAYVFI